MIFTELRSDAPDDAPIALFLHGLAASHRYFGPAMRVPGHRSMFVDLAGYGRSMSAGPPFDLEGQLVQLEAALGEVRPRVIVGHSFGAMLALLCAARWSSVEHVIAFALPAFPSSAVARASIANSGRMERWIAEDSWKARAMCWVMCHARPLFRFLAPWLTNLPADIARDAVLHTWPSFSATYASLLEDAQPTQWLAQTSARVDVVLGEDDTTSPPDVVEALLAGTRAHVRVVPGTHQWLAFEPDRGGALLADLASPTDAPAV